MFPSLWVTRSVSILPLGFLRPLYLMKPQDSKYFLLNDFYNLDLSLHSFTVLKPYDLSNYFTYYPVEFWIFHSASPNLSQFISRSSICLHKDTFMWSWKISSCHVLGAYFPFCISKSMTFSCSRRRRTENSFLPLGIFLEEWIPIKNCK